MDITSSPIANTKPVDTASRRNMKKVGETIFWYLVLSLIAAVTIFPFLWVFFTSFKGPSDPIVSVPPQLIPNEPTFANYIRVWNQLPIPNFFLNSIIVSVSTVVLNLLITSLAAYPLGKMKFKGRDLIFFILLATFVVPPQLTSIPSYVLAVKVFKYYDSILALIFPSLATVFNIFMLRQAFRAVPNDLIEASKMDGASELRLWWSILLPVIKPTLATAAIFTFVNQWNDFFWPSLMLHTRTNMTLQVGLVAMQGMMTSDTRGMAAGVTMTIIPILIFFVLLQKHFVKGLTGAVKG
jgi:putative chitobiose transport system permease protein